MVVTLQKLGLSNAIGGKCPCSEIKFSTCVNEYCMCKTDFTPSEDKRRCLPSKLFEAFMFTVTNNTYQRSSLYSSSPFKVREIVLYPKIFIAYQIYVL